MASINGRVGNQVRFIFNDEGQIVGYRNPETDEDERAIDGSVLASGWFPTDETDADHKGDYDASQEIQEQLDASRGDFPSGKDYGKGGTVLLKPGIIKARDLRMSTWTGLVNQGPQPSSVITMEHTDEGAPLIQIRDDSGQSQSIGSQPLFMNVALNGDRNNAESGVVEDGIKMTDLEGEKDDAPIFFNTIVANFSGNGIEVRPTHKQIRGFNLKSIAHGEYSLKCEKSSDSKIIQGGFGRSLLGQVHLTNCASFQLAQYDIWTPGGGVFEGKYCNEWYGPRNVRYFQGEIQGAVYIEGDNSVPNAKRRHQELGCYFVGFNHKVSPETKAGTQGASYTAMIQIRGADGIHYGFGTFGHDLGPADAEGIAARPKNIWKFGVQGTGAYSGDDTTEKGHVTVTSVEMLHMHYAPATGVDAPGMVPEVPFTEHWASDETRVIWRTHRPGDVMIQAIGTETINMLRADGSSYSPANYPLMYLGLGSGRKLTTAPGSDTLPDCSALEAVLPAGFGAFVVAW